MPVDLHFEVASAMLLGLATALAAVWGMAFGVDLLCAFLVRRRLPLTDLPVAIVVSEANEGD